MVCKDLHSVGVGATAGTDHPGLLTSRPEKDGEEKRKLQVEISSGGGRGSMFGADETVDRLLPEMRGRRATERQRDI